MKDLPQIVIIIGFLIGVSLTIAAILMPLVVLIIDSRLAKVSKCLASMEDMMRNGK